MESSTGHLAPCNRVNCSGCGWLKPDQTGLIEFKCTWYKRELRSLARTSALDFNKEGCVIQIRAD